MYRGRVQAELHGAEITEERVLRISSSARRPDERRGAQRPPAGAAAADLAAATLFVRIGVLPFLLVIALIVFSLLSEQFLDRRQPRQRRCASRST